MVTVCFVCDTNCDRVSASPDTARLMVKSVRRFAPTWEIKCGVFGKSPSYIPSWLATYGVSATHLEELDPDSRFSNKIAAIEAFRSESGYTLFLDCDILMCREFDERCLKGFAGVHTDYPNEGTLDFVVSKNYELCEVPKPLQRMLPTMYGYAVYPAITGVMFFPPDLSPHFFERWFDFFTKIKKESNGAWFSEQAAIMPTIDSFGMYRTYLPPTCNWNSTIYPSHDGVIFNHYHRADILTSDAVARRVMKELGE